MSNMENENKLIQVRIEGDLVTTFNTLKEKLKFKNDSEVLRHAIVFTEKRTPK